MIVDVCDILWQGVLASTTTLSENSHKFSQMGLIQMISRLDSWRIAW